VRLLAGAQIAAVALSAGLSLAGWLDPLAALMFGYIVIQNSGLQNDRLSSSASILASSVTELASQG
jgi:hypothetical protein